MSSVWRENANIPHFESLKKDIETENLIIGGGMAGVLCAYMLDRAGADYVLLEAKTICGGITADTTAKITSQHGLIYDKIASEYGLEKMRLYLEANENALAEFRELAKKIDCDFENKDNFVYSLRGRERLEKEITALRKVGFKAELVENLPLPFKTDGAVVFRNQAQFNPLKFISVISENLNIYENTKVKELIGTTALTSGGKIKAKNIIVATHFPFINKHGAYFIKMYQHRSYVVAVENAENVNGMYVDENNKGMSFRNYKNLLFVGGGGHRTGKQGGKYDELKCFIERNYPKAKEKYRWAAQDCITLDYIPYIGKYSLGTANMFVETGFNKWGMTSSMVAAKVLADMVQGKKNKYAEVFNPSRTIFHPRLASNGAEAVASLLTPSAKRCPHIGCALKWNNAEHTWDCPCHGSRFTSEGKLIDNPSTGDLK